VSEGRGSSQPSPLGAGLNPWRDFWREALGRADVWPALANHAAAPAFARAPAWAPFARRIAASGLTPRVAHFASAGPRDTGLDTAASVRIAGAARTIGVRVTEPAQIARSTVAPAVDVGLLPVLDPIAAARGHAPVWVAEDKKGAVLIADAAFAVASGGAEPPRAALGADRPTAVDV
jgi:hypothetical protein